MSVEPTADNRYRTRCYGCFRPTSECYCDAIPSISNRTDILILQHSRERKHAFNTARMVQRALARSTIVFGTNRELADVPLPLKPNCGLLYPSPDSICLSEIPPDQRPEQLILIDGTWSQAKTMVRDLPPLQSIPHFRINPTQPGQYRIRLEPTDTSLSTVEATVAALREIEPDTLGLDQLLVAFSTMVERQLNHPQVGRECYSGGTSNGRTINIPGRLRGDPSKIIVAYGESAYLNHREQNGQTQKTHRSPLVWLAQRLEPEGRDSDESFARTITPSVPLTDSFLDHLQLSRDYFSNSVSAQQFCDEWDGFFGPDDTLVVFNHGTLQLLNTIGARFKNNLSLKSIHFDEKRKTRMLSEFLDANHAAEELPRLQHGRAGIRLANAIRLVRFLRANLRAK